MESIQRHDTMFYRAEKDANADIYVRKSEDFRFSTQFDLVTVLLNHYVSTSLHGTFIYVVESILGSH